MTIARTIEELICEPEVPCTVFAVQVNREEAVSLLQRGATVLLSQITPDGKGIQLLMYQGKLYHWLGGRFSGDKIDAFPDPTMAGEGLIRESRHRQVPAVEDIPACKCGATMLVVGMLYVCGKCGEKYLRY